MTDPADEYEKIDVPLICPVCHGVEGCYADCPEFVKQFPEKLWPEDLPLAPDEPAPVDPDQIRLLDLEDDGA